MLKRLVGRGAGLKDERDVVSAAHLADIVNIASDAIITTSEDLLILNFNKGAEEVFGFASPEIIGQHINTLIPHRFRDGHSAHVRAFARSEVPARRMGERRQISGLRKNGEEFPAEASISQLKVGGRRLFTVVLRDITERKRAADAQSLLASAGEILASSLDTEVTLSSVARLIVPQLADWCVLYVVSENGDVIRQAIAHRDERTERGLVEQSLHRPVRNQQHPVFRVMESRRPLTLHEVTAPDFAAMSENADHERALRETGAHSGMIVPMVARNELVGAIALFTSSRNRFDDDDVALAHEIARRAALALDNARLYRKAQSAIEARDDVLAVVSHDLGNPLSAIRIGTSLLLSGLSEQERETGGWKHIVGIRNSAEQMERLIKDLLEVKRIEAGQLSVERAKVNAVLLVNEAVELLSPIAEGKNIRLRPALPAELPPIYADRERILQAFSNLVGNAVKFTPPEGEVVISARDGGDYVQFSVTDTGHGISAEDLPHVFDRYWQAKARRRERQGIGLGLVIVKGIVEAHAGNVNAESTPGQGSRFSFAIPLWHDRYGEVE